MIPQDYTVIDLEMTGLHPKNDAILEVVSTFRDRAT